MSTGIHDTPDTFSATVESGLARHTSIFNFEKNFIDCVPYRYTVGGGLCNQLGAHINAIALSAALGAHSLVLPTSATRDSFAKAFMDTEFMCVDSSTLFDFAATREALYGVHHRRSNQ